MRWLRIALLILVLPAVVMLPAEAQVQPVKSPLAFRGSSGETVVRTLNLRITDTNTTNTTVSFLRHDLIDDTGRAIPASAITVDPPKLEKVAAGVQQAKVSITLPARAGTYRGELGVEAGVSSSAVALVVTVDATPAVTVSPATFALRLRGTWTDLAFTGPPTTKKGSGWKGLAGSHGTFDLQQSGTSAATVESINVVGLRQADGDSLPAGAVKVEAVQTVPARDGAAVDVDVSGRNLEPGEYTGTITVAIKEQPTILTLPFTLKVKDGPALALAVMVLGIFVALAFNYWSGKGHAYIAASRQIERLARGVSGEGGQQALPAAERNTALKLLSRAARAIDEGLPPTEVTALITVAEAHISGERVKVEKLLAKLDAAEAAIWARKGKALQKVYTERAKTFRAAISSGRSASITDATREVDLLDADIERWKEAQARFDVLGAPIQAQRMPALDAATTLAAYQAAVDGSPPPAGAPDAPVAPASTDESAVRVITLPRLRGLEALIWGVTLLFVLALGWITLYLAADTFGVDAKDYLSVFLWGTVTSGVFGKAVGFGELKKLAFPGA